MFRTTTPPSWEAASDHADDLTGVSVAEWQRAALEYGQQVGEDVAEQIAAYRWEYQPCPICGRQMGDHNRRELRRCDRSRPDLQIVS